MFFFKTVLVLSFTLSVASLATPRLRAAHHHHALAARAITPVQVPEPLAVRPRKRSNRKRCNAGSNSNSIAAASSTTTADDSPTSSLPASSTDAIAPTTPVSPPATTTPAAAPPAASPTTTTASAPSSSAPSSSTSDAGIPSDLSGTQTGDITFYAPGLGACGVTSSDTDMICAVSEDLYDNFPGATANPNDNPVCNKQIAITLGGQTITVTVVDRCTGCKASDLDLSPTAFAMLADPSVGRTTATWNFL